CLPDAQAVNVVVQVANSATTGLVTFTGAGTGAGNTVTLEIAGNAGTEQLSFAGSSTIAQIATAVNAIKEVTGVSASVNGGALNFNSRNYGSEQFVSVKALSG